jgi:hypothetical protein
MNGTRKGVPYNVIYYGILHGLLSLLKNKKFWEELIAYLPFSVR